VVLKEKRLEGGSWKERMSASVTSTERLRSAWPSPGKEKDSVRFRNRRLESPEKIFLEGEVAEQVFGQGRGAPFCIK